MKYTVTEIIEALQPEAEKLGALKRVLKKAADMGYSFNVGPELEFFLFETDEQGKPTTRTGDEAIYDDAAATLREKKVSDLKNRTKLANETAGGLLISIHQNSMPDHPSVHGAQVFYNGAASGPRLGETVQAALNGAVNAGNGKNAKAIDSTIYLMKNVQCPAILVECGFLSNRTETGQLLTGGYQLKLAVCIAAGFLQHDTEGASA